MRTLLHPARDELQLSGVMAALSDPVRVLIVRALAERGEMACGTLELAVSNATRSHHFRVLREAGVVRQQPEGTARMNTLRREDLDARFPGLLDTILRAT